MLLLLPLMALLSVLLLRQSVWWSELVGGRVVRVGKVGDTAHSPPHNSSQVGGRLGWVGRCCILTSHAPQVTFVTFLRLVVFGVAGVSQSGPLSQGKCYALT